MADGGFQPVERHPFAPEIVAEVRACYRLDNWHGPLELLEHWGVIAAAIGGSMAAWTYAPLWLAVPIYCLAIFLIGGRQRALAGVLHQTVHGTFMRSARLGSILGAVFGGYPVLQSLSGYKASHVRDHHGRFGDRQADPDYALYRRGGVYGAGRSRRGFRRYLLRALGPVGLAEYTLFLLRHRILNRDEALHETVFRLTVLAALVGGLAWSGQLWALAAYWIVPLLTTQAWIGAGAELLEHYPLMEGGRRRDIDMSRNRRFGRVMDFVFGETHGEGYHLVHHLFPRVPIWRLSQAHAILRRDPDYARLPVPEGPLEAYADIWRSLR
mgnify:CR=1 FL=1